MQHYKAPDNSLHFIEPEFAHLLPAGSVQITEDEAETIRVSNAPKPTEDSIRSERDVILSTTIDKINSVRWASLTASQKTAWTNYRQALLDIPEQPGFPESVEWPVAPN